MGPCFGVRAFRLHVVHFAFGLAAVMTVDVPNNPMHPSSNVAAIRLIINHLPQCAVRVNVPHDLPGFLNIPKAEVLLDDRRAHGLAKYAEVGHSKGR